MPDKKLMPSWLSLEEALERLLAFFEPLEREERPLLEAVGQVLAEDIVSPLDVPTVTNSSMDGYAIHAADTSAAGRQTPVTLPVDGYVAAGHVYPHPVAQGHALRIMTGAPIPPGADAVVPFEDTDELEQKEQGAQAIQSVRIYHEAAPGANIRGAGEDVRQGQRVLARGTVIKPATAAVLASLGLVTAPVFRRPTVAILATGDEVVAPGQPLGPGQLYNSNSYGLAALVQSYGAVPKLLGIARDTVEAVEERLAEGMEADLVLTAAGVSRGDYDVVKDVLLRHGEIDFWTVRIRPGKPMAFGALVGTDRRGRPRRVPQIGLPGNPVSALVTCELFARPAILKMLGYTQLARPSVSAVFHGSLTNPDGRRTFARAILERRGDSYHATLSGGQGSHILSALALANALVVLPEERPSLRDGELVQAILLDADIPG